MVLVDLFRPVDPAVDLGREELREADKDLQDKEDIGDDTENGVRRFQVIQAAALLVHLDDDKTGKERENAELVDDSVDMSAFALLIGSVRRL